MQVEVKEVKPVEPPKRYVLTLNQAELDILIGLMGKQGGFDGPDGYRNIMDKMYFSLYKYQQVRDIFSGLHGMIPSEKRVAVGND